MLERFEAGATLAVFKQAQVNLSPFLGYGSTASVPLFPFMPRDRKAR